jgi:hypothetical protein
VTVYKGYLYKIFVFLDVKLITIREITYWIIGWKCDVRAGHSHLIEAPRFDRKGFTSD